MSKAVIIAVGSELTSGRVTEINSGWLAHDLGHRGIDIEAVLTAADSMPGIDHMLLCARGREPRLIVVTGGLGPTHDDMTAAAIAASLNIPVELNQDALEMVAAAVGIPAGELRPHQVKQATLPAGCRALPPAGTAPGFIIKADGAFLVALPGVPHEMRSMWKEAAAGSELQLLFEAVSLRRRQSVFLYGPGESEVGAVVDGVLGDPEPGMEVTICSRYREIMVDIVFPDEYQEPVDRLMAQIRKRFGGAVFSYGEKIAEVIGRELAAGCNTLATGESCTGGMLGEEITTVSGSSGYYRGGVVAYHNDVKRSLMKVRREALENVGAVSEPVAQQLALGARAVLNADYGIGITGVAGPTGGTPEKPVGLVYVCASSGAGDVVRGFNFPGGREDVRRASVVAALHLLRGKILSDRLQAGG
ncbi:MAG: nicotinamide-nucleotide amidohydrolase family protein [Thermoleophilia bacterium]|nr:nicotinamide-nucleotide amidohydrolase family protein [Thermoleophilia bacterium]